MQCGVIWSGPKRLPAWPKHWLVATLSTSPLHVDGLPCKVGKEEVDAARPWLLEQTKCWWTGSLAEKNARWSYDLWLPRSPELAVDIPFVQTQVHQASRAFCAVDTVAVEIEDKYPADRLGKYDDFMAGNCFFFFSILTWTSAFCTQKVIRIGIAKIMGIPFFF